MHLLDRALETPRPTCPTWSHFIQGKVEISIYLSWDKLKESQYNSRLYFIFDKYDETTCCEDSSVDPDWLASSKASISGCTLFSIELISGLILFRVNIWIHAVFKRELFI